MENVTSRHMPGIRATESIEKEHLFGIVFNVHLKSGGLAQMVERKLSMREVAG